MQRFVKLLTMLALIVMAQHGLGRIVPSAAAMPMAMSIAMEMPAMPPECAGHMSGKLGDHCGAMDLCCCALAPAAVARIDPPHVLRPCYGAAPVIRQTGVAIPPALPPPRA